MGRLAVRGTCDASSETEVEWGNCSEVRAERDASPPEEGDWRRLGLALGACEFVAEFDMIW